MNFRPTKFLSLIALTTALSARAEIKIVRPAESEGLGVISLLHKVRFDFRACSGTGITGKLAFAAEDEDRRVRLSVLVSYAGLTNKETVFTLKIYDRYGQRVGQDATLSLTDYQSLCEAVSVLTPAETLLNYAQLNSCPIKIHYAFTPTGPVAIERIEYTCDRYSRSPSSREPG